MSNILQEPIKVGPFELRGRVYLPAHQPGLASGGQVTDQYIEYHRQRARAGMAMQVTGANPIIESEVWPDICLWNKDESIVPGYRRLAAAVHAEGGRMIAQLAHPGPTEEEGPEVFGPSRDFSEFSRQVAVAATRAQLDQVIDEYAAASDRCRRGDLDGIELSMAHGNLPASFLSPLTNRRDDEYGGDFERRLFLIHRIIDASREALGHDRILGIRLGIDDMVEGGLTPEEGGRIAAALEDKVDYISVMVGNNNRLEARARHWPPDPAEPGLFRSKARIVKEAVKSVPVCAVGRVLTMELAEHMVASGDTDIVGMVRAHIADPNLMPLSLAGKADEVRPCVGANVCVNSLMLKKPLTCHINPDVADADEFERLPRLDGHTSVVVGSGPAGLEAARRLAHRGSSVTLFEAADRVGGRMGQWAKAPSRKDSEKWVRWAERMIRRYGADIRLGTRADAAAIAELRPDAVVLAIGAPDATIEVPGDGSVPVVTADRAFEPGAVRGRVLVHDRIGELDAPLIAEYLHSVGVEPVLSTERLHIGEGDGFNTLVPMLRTLTEKGIRIIERVKPIGVEDCEVELEDIFGVGRQKVAVDAIVSWAGGDPDPTLADELRELGIEPIVIGDALRPRRVTEATQDAKRLTDPITAGEPATV